MNAYWIALVFEVDYGAIDIGIGFERMVDTYYIDHLMFAATEAEAVSLFTKAIELVDGITSRPLVEPDYLILIEEDIDRSAGLASNQDPVWENVWGSSQIWESAKNRNRRDVPDPFMVNDFEKAWAFHLMDKHQIPDTDWPASKYLPTRSIRWISNQELDAWVEEKF